MFVIFVGIISQLPIKGLERAAMQNDRTNVSYLLLKYDRHRPIDEVRAIENVEPSISFRS